MVSRSSELKFSYQISPLEFGPFIFPPFFPMPIALWQVVVAKVFPGDRGGKQPHRGVLEGMVFPAGGIVKARV